MTDQTQDKDKPKRPRRPKKGEVVEVPLESLVYGGPALGRVEGFVVFVPHAAPGERVRARITKRKGSYAQAELLGMVEPAPERIAPKCPLFTTCGGCWWQHLPVEVQEHWKEQIVRESIHPIVDKNPGEIEFEPLVSSPDPFHYRNKMEFTFGQEKYDKTLKLGFHKPGNWKHILDVQQCWLHPKAFDGILNAARAEGERQGLNAWNPVEHAGMLRHLVVRWSVYEERALVALLTGDREGLDFEAFRRALVEACPAVKGVAWGLNAGRSDVARAEEILRTWGEDSFEERLGDLRFQVSLSSFFQTNTRGAEKLYKVAHEYLELSGRERLLDAYCGTGTIGIYCARDAAHVYGIELVREAVWDARENAERNGLSNCTFMAGDMARTLPALAHAVVGSMDRLVVDPPRGGMDKKALALLANLRAPVVVYVSCNPTTMARDLGTMIEAGYRVEKVRAVDMFPQTYHIECVTRCVLER